MIIDELAIDIAGLCLPALKRPDANPDPDPKATARLRGAVSGLLNEKYDPASFTPAMRIFLTTATGKALWKWFAEHGVLGSFVFSNKEERKDGQVFRYKISLGGNWYWLSVTTNNEEKIAQIYWW